MARRPTGPLRVWEETLLAAYRDYLYRRVLTPLAERVDQWRAEDITHEDLDAALHVAHTELQKVYALVTGPRRELAAAAVADRRWYEAFLAEVPPPDDDDDEGAPADE